jgi:hypothetical protein
MVSWRQSIAPECERVSRAAVYQLQHGARVVPYKFTANWLAAPGQQWTVPIGGGFGRIFKLGDQPVSANIAAYYNVVRPTGTPNWQLRAELSLLFPER